MILTSLELEGYGRLSGRRFAFAPGLNVVYGANEAGKSTLVDAIVALLYGPGRKDERDAKRPWSGAKYRAILRYALADGRAFELHREFTNGRTARVFDHNGNDVTADLTVKKDVVPGQVHLSLPREVFVNAACVRQQFLAVDSDAADRISASLAQALDGGPREDAARRALESLDAALRLHVGSERATKRAPLRDAVQRAADAESEANAARETLRGLLDARERLAGLVREHDDLHRLLAEHRRRGLALRAASLRSRLEQLRQLREEIGGLDAERARYGDVVAFSEDRVPELEARYFAWQDARTRAALTAEEAQRAADAVPPEPAGPPPDVETLAALEAAATEAEIARAEALAATNEAAAGRGYDAGDGILGLFLVLGAVALVVAIGAAIAHWWTPAAIAGVVTLLWAALALTRISKRRARRAEAARRQARADAAIARETSAAAQLAALLGPFGLPNAAEGRRRADQAQARAAAEATASAAGARAREAAGHAKAAGAAFDALAATLIEPTGSREADLERARGLALRLREREGLEASVRMKDVLRVDLLRGEDELALENELAELVAAGVAETAPASVSTRAFEAEGAELETRLREAAAALARSEAEIAAAERTLPDIAALDDEAAASRAEALRLEAFERAIKLARTTIEERTREAHEKFARRLEDYAAVHIAQITDHRYADLRVDPTSLAIRVRVPETGAIEDLDALSAGTRDQIYLVVRFAMARMFAEGLETPPLLLDDPFAFWDDDRLARCLPILRDGARTMQTLVFTSSRAFCAAAEAEAGAQAIALDPVLV